MPNFGNRKIEFSTLSIPKMDELASQTVENIIQIADSVGQVFYYRHASSGSPRASEFLVYVGSEQI